MWSRGIARMCVGARGAMSRNAMTTSSSWTLVDGISPATILQNRQFGSAAIDSSGGGWGGRRNDADEATDDTLGRDRVDVLEPDMADDVLECPVRGGVDGDERVVRRVPDPATVAEARLEQDVRIRADAATGPPRPRVGGQGEELGRAGLADPLVDRACHPDRRRAGTCRIAEDVDAGEADRPDEIERAAPGVVVLGREADDHVAVDRGARDRVADAADGRGVVGGEVAPAHPPEDAIVP